jgi:hypothetical protein
MSTVGLAHQSFFDVARRRALHGAPLSAFVWVFAAAAVLHAPRV